MASVFESAAWHEAIGEVVQAEDDMVCASAMIKAIGLVVDHEGTCLLAFHNDARPEVVHHTLEPAAEKHYLERYLAGPYLLDPLYQLALAKEKPTLCRFRDQLPDRFRSSEYYRQYCEQTHLLDEMDYISTVSERTTLAWVVGRRSRTFKKSELRRLKLIEPTVQACIKRVWQRFNKRMGSGGGDDAVHQRLTDCFDKFGRTVLTTRERQISQFLLRGHSSKSIARELNIAPGTVMVHKRNLFAKLGISSQYELFSLFIDELGAQ